MEYCPAPKTLAQLLDQPYRGDFFSPLLINDIQIDSRKVAPGTLFVAVPGTRDNGEKYIAAAVEHGAAAIVVDDARFDSVHVNETPVIGVPNIGAALPRIASRFFSAPSQKLAVYGVTGTNGKSTITSMIAQLAQLLQKPAAVMGTLGFGLMGEASVDTGLTTPDVVSCHRILAQMYELGAQVVAMEVSSHGIHQRRIAEIAFECGVISNVTRDHLDYHGSFAAYAAVKESFLLSGAVRHLALNLDDESCRGMLANLQATGKPLITFGVDNPSADVNAHIVQFSPASIALEIRSPWGTAAVRLPMVGHFNVSNALAALAALCVCGEEFQRVAALLEKLIPVTGRLEPVSVEGDGALPKVFVDYAHTPDALDNALRALRHHTMKNLWVVFGCGGDRDKGKRPLMAAAAAALADYVVVTSDNPRGEDVTAIVADIMEGFDHSVAVEVIVERSLAIAFAISNAKAGDVVLIAGKGHEDYQLIGDKKLPFSDVAVARNVLQQRGGSH